MTRRAAGGKTARPTQTVDAQVVPESVMIGLARSLSDESFLPGPFAEDRDATGTHITTKPNVSDQDVIEIIAQMTKRGQRAIMRIGHDWIAEGKPGPSHTDAYSLWWGRDSQLGLVERPRYIHPDQWMWRATPVGLRVRAYLVDQAAISRQRRSSTAAA